MLVSGSSQECEAKESSERCNGYKTTLNLLHLLALVRLCLFGPSLANAIIQEGILSVFTCKLKAET